MGPELTTARGSTTAFYRASDIVFCYQMQKPRAPLIASSVSGRAPAANSSGRIFYDLGRQVSQLNTPPIPLNTIPIPLPSKSL